MRDVLGIDIRRGDHLIDQWGHLFVVSGVTPKNVHLQDAKTGRRFRQSGRAISRTIPMLRARGDLGNQQERRNKWVKEVLYERGLSLKSEA
ncbi:hypothetical protein LCGC14_2562670 [marine sediment metagenome]|uniref:Uncharacterized protein n=1 Tax=marine sediment metagenome TaxID=412755 RepID=A0A0F9AJK9_9ZZZZ